MCPSQLGAKSIRDQRLNLVDRSAERAQLDLHESASVDVSAPPRTCSACPLIMCGSESSHSLGTAVSRSV